MGARRRVRAWMAIPLAVLGAVDAAEGQRVHAVSAAVDNDGLQMWTPWAPATDWYYTHGTRLEVVLDWVPPGASSIPLVPLMTGALARACAHDRDPGPCVVTRLGVSQRIFTPRDHVSYTPRDSADRPYAGWLSGTLTVERSGPGGLAALDVEVGVTGEPSLGRQAYGIIHRWFDTVDGEGWEHQIPFEVAWSVGYREVRRPPPVWTPGPFAVSVEPRWGARVGTLRTGGTAGVSVRAGTSGAPGAAWRGRHGGATFVAVTVGVEGEAVVRDLFLDGSLWRRTPRAETARFVGRVRSGVTAGWGRIGVDLALTRSTREFAAQEGSHAFGTIALTVRR